MSNKLIITKPGFNALTETDPNNLIFSSDYNTLKYDISGSANVNWTDNGTIYTTTVAHNLGYIPFFVAFVLEGGSSVIYNTVPNNNTTLAGEDYIDAYVDETNIYFKVHKNQGTGHTGTETFYYKIFKNNLGL